MGESVKILNPEKNIYVVDEKADCPMAHMITVEKIKQMREEYEDLAVVCYINSTAEIKVYSDVCVTSSNAVKIVKKLKEKNIFFIPDGNLGRHVAKFVPEKNIIPNDGYCPIHNKITEERIKNLKKSYPNSYTLAHPECNKEVLEIVDYIGSTSGIIEKVGERDEEEIIIVTESGISYMLGEKYPDKKFIYLEEMICDDMKLINEEKILEVLKTGKNEIIVDSEIAEKAKIPLMRMLELGD